MRPVLVVAPPRSGTSFVARILHERLGVCMGHELGTAEANPRGFFEEQRMWKHTQALVAGELEPAAWLEVLHELHREHTCQRIGLKDPRLVFAPLRQLRPALVVRPRREPKAIASSWVRWNVPKVSEVEALEQLALQEHRLDEVTPELLELCPVLEVSLREQWEDEELVRALRPVLQAKAQFD